MKYLLELIEIENPDRCIRQLALMAMVWALNLMSLCVSAFAANNVIDSLPQRLSDTGLFAPGHPQAISENALSFSPQYPLWSDGALKRRWIFLPPGSHVDASNPDAWEFPIGTKIWKEFGHEHPVETRFIERLADGNWRFAAYVWNANFSDADLAPSKGQRVAATGAPGGQYDIPSRDDCRACHEGAPVPVLGFSALQLSPIRDQQAPHAEPRRPDQVDLPSLVQRGVLQKLPLELLLTPPRIAARSPIESAALGYMHGNCAHCHNRVGPLALLELNLAQEVWPATNVAVLSQLDSLLVPSQFRLHGNDSARHRLLPGQPESSVLALRMGARDALTQMPPLGTRITDDEGLAMITRWIQHDLKQLTPNTRAEITP